MEINHSLKLLSAWIAFHSSWISAIIQCQYFFVSWSYHFMFVSVRDKLREIVGASTNWRWARFVVILSSPYAKLCLGSADGLIVGTEGALCWEMGWEVFFFFLTLGRRPTFQHTHHSMHCCHKIMWFTCTAHFSKCIQVYYLTDSQQNLWHAYGVCSYLVYLWWNWNSETEWLSIRVWDLNPSFLVFLFHAAWLLYCFLSVHS